MKIFHGIGNIQGKFRGAVLAIGVFDGVHRGHQALIRKAVERAKKIRRPSVVLTFDPHPAHVLRPGPRLPLLTTLSYRLQLIDRLGVDAIVIFRFTLAFSRRSPEKFIIQNLVNPMRPAEVIVGDDFRFGQDRAGTIDFFKEAGKKFHFKVFSLKTVSGGEKKFSSSAAREAVGAGNLKKAAAILGRPVSVSGRVVTGDRRGKRLGFPTANIVPAGELLPPSGVYCARVILDGGKYLAMVNVGCKPSFHRGGKISVEAHIFDFNKNIYGHEIVIEFLRKIRNELSFASSQALISQLKKDEAFSRRWFASHHLK